jgi:putative endonuclease
MYEFESRSGHTLYNFRMFFVYVLHSLSRNYIYVGMTSDIKRRVEDHNNGYNKTTKPYRPFKLMLVEEYPTRVLAREREKYLKTGIGKEYLKSLPANLPIGRQDW